MLYCLKHNKIEQSQAIREKYKLPDDTNDKVNKKTNEILIDDVQNKGIIYNGNQNTFIEE